MQALVSMTAITYHGSRKALKQALEAVVAIEQCDLNRKLSNMEDPQVDDCAEVAVDSDHKLGLTGAPPQVDVCQILSDNCPSIYYHKKKQHNEYTRTPW